jgi:hypothetical protein
MEHTGYVENQVVSSSGIYTIRIKQLCENKMVFYISLFHKITQLSKTLDDNGYNYSLGRLRLGH